VLWSWTYDSLIGPVSARQAGCRMNKQVLGTAGAALSANGDANRRVLQMFTACLAVVNDVACGAL